MAGNQRGEATRQRILAAAECRFAELGIALTLDDVAQAASTTRMTVHRHTGGREQLVRHLVLRASARLGDQLTEILGSDRPVRDRLADAMVATVEALRATPTLSSLLTDRSMLDDWEAIDPEGTVGGRVHQFLLGHLEEADARGELRVPPSVATAWLLAQVRVMLAQPWLAEDEEAVRTWFDTLVLHAVLTDAVLDSLPTVLDSFDAGSGGFSRPERF